MIQEKTKELDEKIQQLDGSFFGLKSGLDPEFKEKWIKALASGAYNQRDAYLYYKDEDYNNTGYCCLGVACVITDIYNTVENDPNSIFSRSEIKDLGSTLLDIPEKLRPFVKPSSSTIVKNYLCSTDFAEVCMTLNDELEFTFKEIACWLEHYVDTVEKLEDYE